MHFTNCLFISVYERDRAGIRKDAVVECITGPFTDQITLALIFVRVAREEGTSVCWSFPPFLAIVVYTASTTNALTTFALAVSCTRHVIAPIFVGEPVCVANGSQVCAEASIASCVFAIVGFKARLTFAVVS